MNTKNLFLTTPALCLLTTGALAQGLPNSFTNGQIADANQINANFEFVNTRATTVAEDLSSAETRIDELSAQLSTFNEQLAQLNERFDNLGSVLTAQNLAKLEQILPFMSVVQIDGLDGSSSDTILFEGVNLQIANGSGSTAQVNGAGNLIIGYHELASPVASAPQNFRSGSHNVILGRGNAYTSFGGIVAGSTNTIAGPDSSVLSGGANRAVGESCIVLTGLLNVADGVQGAVVTGRRNTTDGAGSAVVGGEDNLASGTRSAVVGGRIGLASGSGAVTVGGNNGRSTGIETVTVGGFTSSASGIRSTAVGGHSNSATAQHATVSGGFQRTASGNEDWVGGGLTQNF